MRQWKVHKMQQEREQIYAGLEASSEHFLGLIPAVPSAGDQHPTQSRHSSAFRMTGTT